MDNIRTITPEDKDWVEKIFKANADQLGPFSMTWYFYWKGKELGKGDNEFFEGIPGVAFIHYRRKRNGVNTLYEIAVSEEARGKGIGRGLIEHIGNPISLKTRQDNLNSNAFYVKLGLELIGTSQSKDGKLKYNLYGKS